jgi:hypothetical protein
MSLTDDQLAEILASLKALDDADQEDADKEDADKEDIGTPYNVIDSDGEEISIYPSSSHNREAVELLKVALPAYLKQLSFEEVAEVLKPWLHSLSYAGMLEFTDKLLRVYGSW